MNIYYRWRHFCLCAVFCLPFLTSCRDDYFYDNEEPEWLGKNVYDYLLDKENYTTYLTLIDQLGYREILQRTGSKTIFPANDEAYADFFRSHNLSGNGADIVKGMTPSQQRVLFNSTVLNMAYLDNMLANIATSNDGDESGEGIAMVRETSASYLDSIRYVVKDLLPQTEYWSRFAKQEGIWLMDNASRPNVIFTPHFMAKMSLSANDWNLLFPGKPYDSDGFYVNGSHVLSANKNITCKNGYLHIPSEVVYPLENIAEVIASSTNTSTFHQLLDKFSAPYFDEEMNKNVHNYYEDDLLVDSVYVKRYFNDNGTGACLQTPDQKDLPATHLLYFDPSYNQLAVPTDIGVMLVPTNQAMKEYWESDRGKFLRSVYSTWDDVPMDVLCKFVKNHQLKSFTSSLPHEWDNLSDQKGFLLNLKSDDIKQSILACNGVVYQTNRVFPPIDYQCAYGPILTSPLTKIMKVAIDDNDALKFHLYLRSLENQYNLLIPIDAAMQEYRDPISWALWATTGVDKREIWSFKLVGAKIYVDIYNVNEDGSKGSLKQTIGATSSEQERIMNRLNDIIDMNIIVADNISEPLSGFVDSGMMQYALTKGGTIIKVAGEGGSTTLRGGGDDELGLPDTKIHEREENIYLTENSHTFFTDRILQDPFKSVYATLMGNSEFDEFYSLLLGDPTVFSYFQDDKDVTPIFDQSVTEQSSGIGQIVTSFNNYRYTILVPSNEAIRQTFAEDPNLWTWSRISNEEDPILKKEKCLYLLNFLRHHFIDGIVPISGNSFSKKYDTAARNANNQFVKIQVESTGSQIRFGGEAQVITENSANYNILSRDYIVNNKDPQKATSILASSRAIIHLVDRAINYQKQ